MNEMMKSSWDVRFTVALSILLGLLLYAVLDSHWALDLYNKYNPVVDMQGELVQREGDAVVVHIWGEKSRECKYVGIQSFAKKNHTLFDTYISRVDKTQDNHTRPTGSFDIGWWRIRPVTLDVSHVVVYSQHECRGRLVTTLIAEVPM